MAPPQWAYQVENFVNEPDEELICSICRAVFCDPVMCPCDHVFCRACITKWIQSSRNCPICRKRVSYSSVKQMVPIVKNIIMKLMVNCHNNTLGCQEQFSVESSENHVKECEYELVQCKNRPCTDRLFRKDVTEHETSDCPHRYIKCKTCGLKLPTSALPEKHNCVRALQLRLRRKSSLIRKKNDRIKELRNEIKALKSASQGSEQSASSSSREFAQLSSSLSPDEIMINIADFDSTSSSLSTDSEDSSEDSIIIFTDGPLRRRSDNEDSDSFLTFMDSQDSIEYSRSDSPSPRNFNEYRNAESQTTDDFPVNDQQNGLPSSTNDNAALETGVSSETVARASYSENEERSQSRPVKRRPSTSKPAKRRFPLTSNFGISESSQNSPCSPGPSFVETNRDVAVESNHGNDERSTVEAGPSTAAGPSSEELFSDWIPAAQKKRSRPTNNVNEGTEDTVPAAPSRNSLFRKTLALLEQYSLESDPEWLPEYASHRGDTTSDSDISYEEAEFISGDSTSELSGCDEDNSNEIQHAAISDLVNCSFDTSDEDDPDWNPIQCLENRYEI